jgi:hypothetical protein
MAIDQYTVRKIPKDLNRALRVTSKHTGKSINSIFIDALYQHIEKQTNSSAIKRNDLAWMSGKGQGYEQFDDITTAMRNVDLKDWQ